MPDSYADGCWPSEKHLGLVHSQQIAVNTILATLGKSEGLLGINGPPGTGKTTLLRDLIAAIVTQRADVLAGLRRASDVFLKDGREVANDGGVEQAGFKLDPALYGFEIVVASSNNGAVENVTLELPQRDKVDETWLPEGEYFAELGELTTGKPAWGMVSGALGSKSRRTAFVNRYFYGHTPRKRKGKPKPGTPEASDSPVAEDNESASFSWLTADEEEAMESGEGNQDDQESTVVSDGTENEDEAGPRGFLGWLGMQAQANSERNPEQRQRRWRNAVAEYNAAKLAARQASEGARRIRAVMQDLGGIDYRTESAQATLGALEQQLAEHRRQLLGQAVQDTQAARHALETRLMALSQHLDARPVLWSNLLSLWQTQRRWNEKHAVLEQQRALAQFEFDRLARVNEQIAAAQGDLERRADAMRKELAQLYRHRESLRHDASDLARTYQAHHLLAWLEDGVIGRGDAIELAEPWRIEGWRQTRAHVFLQALKLHRTFFELEPLRLRTNLFLVNALLTGTRMQGMSRDAVRSAWASLFMVVPVLSSTFASFSRSFATLMNGEIGWLLVDETGQATPQAAVGALWRSRRAVFVGDPLQLKPIMTVSDAVLEHMRTRYHVDSHWLPNRQSAQTLADEATPWGRLAGPAGGKTWVGLPLVVHRRCDRPMYALANRIAYDGTMVYGTIPPAPTKDTLARLDTGWIDAPGPSEDNWVPAEGEALRDLLQMLRADGVKPDEISVITPFRAVVQRLNRMLPRRMVHGTIHTMQGKESAVVILVLGASSDNSGARNWAVSEPNLLNVAATRAKRRLYVIGDRSDWQERALFCDVMDLLPEQFLTADIRTNPSSPLDGRRASTP
ncbi:DNA helicase related protein [Candidatus Burkholderia verschuerenii]|uniref:DNA helicase related protein n=2 Tax=Candidatus Burkholderia verschuerenii TaxID=242163 RepID=A0A0L0M4N4_9BURK|nr:DNA helicase related protein [Candidatus Burkholderia verschuerenii]